MNSLTAPTLRAHTRVNVKRVTQETDRSAPEVRLRLGKHDFHLRSFNPQLRTVMIQRGYFRTKIHITRFREDPHQL